MRNMKLYTALILLFLLFPIIIFAQSNPMDVATQTGSLVWNRLPSDAELDVAVGELVKQLGGNISVGGTVVDERSFEVSKIVKLHNKELAGKREPGSISSARIYSAIYGTYGTTINSYSLVQNIQEDKFYFIGTYMGSYRPSSLEEAYNNSINEITGSPFTALGFAPPLGESSTEGTAEIGGDQSSSGEDFPWEVVIGLLGTGGVAGGAAALARKLFRKKPGQKQKQNDKTKKEKRKEEEKKEGEEEQVKYILNLNKEHFKLSAGQSDLLEVVVYKITPKTQKKFPAQIQLINPEKALSISPTQAQGSLTARMILEGTPNSATFNITVQAVADGHQFQKFIQIQTQGKKQLSIETLPGNKRSLRPDTYQMIEVRARILDENDKPVPELTEQIIFKPKSDWIDLSEPILDDDYIALNMGCTSPNPDNKTANMPSSVNLMLLMEDVPEGEAPLRQDLEINLLDCKLETEIEEATFPVSDDMSEITFDVWIENVGDEKGWNFNGEYRYGSLPTDPLTYIDIQPKGESKVSVTLTGPLIKPKEGDSITSKTLIIYAAQGDEKPLERHLNIMVMQEGLLIKNGVNKQNEIHILASKPFEEDIDFALYRYDKQSNQVMTDKEGLAEIQFELQSEEPEIINLASVLQPEFMFEGVVNNIPYGRYHFTTKEEIPGTGDVYILDYLVKAPSGDADRPEYFEKNIRLKVKTYGIGEEFPDWVKAYEWIFR
jgi:hypothetical protein